MTILWGTNDPCLKCGKEGSKEYIQCQQDVIAGKGFPACTGAISPAEVQRRSKALASDPANYVQGAAQNIATDTLSNMLQPLLGKLGDYGIHIALFMFAFMLAIIGLWILTRNPVEDSGSLVTAGLNNAAKGVGSGIGRGIASRKAKREGKRAAKLEAKANTAIESGNKKQAVKLTIKQNEATSRQKTYARKAINPVKAKKEAAKATAAKQVESKTPTVAEPKAKPAKIKNSVSIDDALAKERSK